MIFHLLIYSIISFFSPVISQSNLPSFPVDFEKHVCLSKEKDERFIQALVGLYKKQYDGNATGFIVKVKKVLHNKESYEKFVISVAYRIDRDENFACYLDTIKFFNKETLYSFFMREFDRIKKACSHTHHQKNKMRFLDDMGDLCEPDILVPYSSFNEDSMGSFEESHNRSLGMCLQPTGIQESKRSKSNKVPNETSENNTSSDKQSNQNDFSQKKHDDYHESKAQRERGGRRSPEDIKKIATFYPEGAYLVDGVPVEDSVAIIDGIKAEKSDGVLHDESDIHDAKHEGKFDPEFKSREDEVFQKMFTDQVDKVLRDREQRQEELSLANKKILTNGDNKKKAFDYLAEITNDLLSLFGIEPNLDLSLEQEEILNRLVFSSGWPSDLPSGSRYQNVIEVLRQNIVAVMIDEQGFPRVGDTVEIQKEKARILAEFLSEIFDSTSEWDSCVPESSKNAYHYFVDKGIKEAKVPFLKQAYEELHKEVGYLESAGDFLYGAGSSLVSLPGSIAHKVADTLGFNEDRPNTIDPTKYCNDLDDRRKAFLDGNHATAFEIADKYWGTPHYKKMIEPLKKDLFAQTNEYGIPLAYEKDPLWINTPDHIKNKLRNDVTSLKSNARFDTNKLKDLQDLRSFLSGRSKKHEDCFSYENHFDYSLSGLSKEFSLPEIQGLCKEEYYEYLDRGLNRPLAQDMYLTDVAKKEIDQIVKTTTMKKTVNDISELEDPDASCDNYLSKEAFEVRLEALQQAHLYQNPQIREEFKQLPEYNDFVCSLAQELEKNPERFGELRHRWLSNEKNSDLRPINLATYFKHESYRILNDKQNNLENKSKERFEKMNERIIQTTDAYLKKINNLPLFEAQPEVMKQLQNLNLLGQEYKNNFNAQAYYESLCEINNGPLDLQDLMDAAQNAQRFSQRYNQDIGFRNLSNLLDWLEELDQATENFDLENQIDENIKPSDDLIDDNKETQSIIDEYKISASSLLRDYKNPAQNAVHKNLKSRLAAMASDLNEDEKKLTSDLAELAIALNDAGQMQQAGSLLGVFSSEKIHGFFDGITSELKNIYAMDADQLAQLAKGIAVSTVAQRAILFLPPPVRIGYCAYQLVRMARDGYASGNAFVSDITELIEVIGRGDMHRAGELAVRTAHDGYDLYINGKGLKSMGSTFYRAYKDINKKRMGGGQRNGKKEGKDQRPKFPTCQTMNDFLNNHELGKVVKSNSVKTKKKYYGKNSKGSGAAVYKAVTDIPGTPIKEGNYFYLDYAHKDHIEVFSDSYKVETVMRLDGSIWKKKAKTAKAEKRNIKKDIK